MGNILFKTDAGNFSYDNPSRPFQITEQTNIPPDYDDALLTVAYTSFDRPKTISKSGNTATFLYNHTGERTKMTVTSTNPYTLTYLGNYEHETCSGTTTERLYLGGTPYNAPTVAIRTNNGSWQLHYIHRDNLGSIVAITNSATTNTAVETNSYDPWGRLRNTLSLTPYAHNQQPSLLRLYDPVIGRLLSPAVKIFPPTALIYEGHNFVTGKDMFNNQPISDYRRVLAPVNAVIVLTPFYYPQMQPISVTWSLTPKEFSQGSKY